MLNFPFDSVTVSEIKVIMPTRAKYRGEVDNYPGFPYSILTYRYSGKSKYFEPDGNEFDFCENDILYIPSHYRYSVRKNEIGRICVINFIQTAEITDRIFRFRLKDTNRLRELFEMIEEHWTRENTGYHNKCISILYEIFSLMERKSVEYISGVRKNQLLSVKEYIDKCYLNPDADLSTETLARICELSQGHFNKLFREYFHKAPRQYICEKRIADAECMMLSGIRNVSEIARECGFGSVHYFSRYFKIKTGVSPSEYLGLSHGNDF